MTEVHDYIIVGAGLSGLSLGYEFTKRGVRNFKILEGRGHIGGRIQTTNSIDLGATWFQDHHVHLKSLIEELGIPKFRQYARGKGIFIYSSMAPAQYFESDPNTPSGYRIGGGSQALIKALAHKIADKITVNATVLKIQEEEEAHLKVVTRDHVYHSKRVILALPPQLITNIDFAPNLPDTLLNAVTNTHTWMSNAIKVGLTYERPFWREKSFSGTLIGHVSPVIEIYDHSNIEDNAYALMGFVNEGLRDEQPRDRQERIVSYLCKHLGNEAAAHTSYLEKDWSIDEHTSSQKLKSVYISPKYGNPLFQQPFLNDRLYIIGAETASQHGGYMDGAVISAQSNVERILKNV